MTPIHDFLTGKELGGFLSRMQPLPGLLLGDGGGDEGAESGGHLGTLAAGDAEEVTPPGPRVRQPGHGGEVEEEQGGGAGVDKAQRALQQGLC